jgi:hypothetical protein
MLGQVASMFREYPMLPGTTEDQGVLWHMSTVLLTAFGFFYVATPMRPLSDATLLIPIEMIAA